MKTLNEVARWRRGAAERFGDPSLCVCQIFFRHVPNADIHAGDDDLVFSVDRGELILRLTYDHLMPISLSPAGMEIDSEGELMAFGAERISSGLWVLQPSLNVPGLIHAHVALYGVPHPAPWERLIELVG